MSTDESACRAPSYLSNASSDPKERTTMAATRTSTTPKATGPASYFPSIEARYGRPIEEWLDLVRPLLAAGEAHMAVVAVLKGEHGMGHGHANAVVAHARAEGA